MKDKQIAQVTPYMMDGHLIISFDEEWIQVFNGIPTFTALLDKDSRLCLLGPVISKKKEIKEK